VSLLDALLEAAGGRRRLGRAEVWRAFQRAHPVEAAADDARERLITRLHALAITGRLGLPAESGSGWDRSARPAFPEWVLLPRAEEPMPAVDVKIVPWAPELAFVLDLPKVEHLNALLAIQRFFAAGGRSRSLVPMRERSVQLFGDEKRLDQLTRTPLFAEGRLTLEMLRCFPMAPPLAFEPGPAGSQGRPVLVIENHHTWWSFCRWNAREGAYAAVAYGAGGAFGRQAVEFLSERCREWSAPFVLYFGDLDPEGLELPFRAARFAEQHGLRILPERRWYARLLEYASTMPLPVGAPLPVKDALSWLPGDLRDEVGHHFEQGIRIPQELVGTEALESERCAPADSSPP
jgi:hypothetical protein